MSHFTTYYSLRLAILTLHLFASISTPAAEEEKPTEGINPWFLKSVVSIEQKTGPDQSRPIGTGFLVLPTESKTFVLVTAKHVIADSAGNLVPNLGYRLNERGGNSILFEDQHATRLLGGWYFSSNADVAARLIIFRTNSDFVPVPESMFLDPGRIRAGAPVLVAGFPMGLRSESNAVAIVRSGIVARPDLQKLLIDGFVFPGNSGGPVFYVPALRFKSNDQLVFTSPTLGDDMLIGLVSTSISYTEPAVSPQTLRQRIVFEENAGLCEVIPTTAIKALIERDDFHKAIRATSGK